MGDALGHTSGVDAFPVHRGALRWAFRGLGAGLVLGTLLGCAGLTGDSAGADSAEADSASEAAAPLDVLLVFDTSGSMTESGGALVLGADDIVAALGEEDWRFGITTTSANYASGPTSGVDPGEAGTLVAAAIVPGSDAVLDLRIALACSTIYFKESGLRSDPDYHGEEGDCPEPESGVVSWEYLDCLCPDGWNQDEGSGTEEGLEAAVDALCRGEDPPDSCFDDSVPITAADAGSVDLWREDSRRRIWVISDEGDGSRRVPTADASAEVYLDLFEELGGPRFSCIGPRYVEQDGTCLDGAQTWGVQRYQAAVEGTGGEYRALTEGPDEDCAGRDVAALLAEGLAEDH